MSTPDEVEMLSRSEEVALVRAAKAGNHASKERLFLAHLPLVRSIAKGYRRPHHLPLASIDGVVQQYRVPVAWDDFLSEGFIGLEHALVDFDPDLGFRFNTYARHKVRQCVQEYAQRNRSVAGGPRKGGVFDIPLTAMARNGKEYEVDHVLGDREDGIEETIIARYEVQEARATVADALTVLDDRERIIFQARHLSDNPPHLSVLAAQFKLSSERIRQIQVQAFDKVAARVRRFARKLSHSVFNIPPGPITPLDERIASGCAYPSLTALLMGDPIKSEGSRA